MTRKKYYSFAEQAEKECITDMITELNKLFDFARIQKNGYYGGYSLIVDGFAVLKIKDFYEMYDKIAAFLQGAHFMAEKDLLNL